MTKTPSPHIHCAVCDSVLVASVDKEGCMRVEPCNVCISNAVREAKEDWKDEDRVMFYKLQERESDGC
jgi:hypothetical protein